MNFNSKKFCIFKKIVVPLHHETLVLTFKAFNEMRQSVVITTDRSAFTDINVPFIGKDWIKRPLIPTNIEFDEVYYLYSKKLNQVTAFKLLAISYRYDCFETYRVYYVKYATKSDPIWVNDIFKNNIVFKSLDDFNEYIANGYGRVVEKDEPLDFDSAIKDGSGLTIKRTYYWNKSENRPKMCNSQINHILITKDKVYISISHIYRVYSTQNPIEGFETKEDCIKANMNGLTIVKFDEPSLNIKVDFEVNDKPKVIKVIFVNE